MCKIDREIQGMEKEVILAQKLVKYFLLVEKNNFTFRCGECYAPKFEIEFEKASLKDYETGSKSADH